MRFFIFHNIIKDNTLPLNEEKIINLLQKNKEKIQNQF